MGEFNPQYQQFQPPPGPPVQPYWTANDDIRYAKVSQGLAQVQDDLDVGELHPEYAQPLLEELTKKRTEMEQRKQATQQAAKQQQMQEMLHSNAMQQSMLQADAAHDAQNFQNRTARYTDPLTGQTAHLYQKRQGEWEQLDLQPDVSPQEGGGGGGGGVPGPDSDEPAKTTPETIPPPAHGGPSSMTIYNGANREEAVYDGTGHRVSQQFYDREGQPVQPKPAEESSGFAHTPTQLAGFRRAALEAIGLPHLFGTPAQQAHQLDRHNQAVNQMAHDLQTQDAKNRQHGIDAKARAEQHTKDAEARLTRDKEHAKLQQERDLTAKQKIDLETKAREEIRKERKDWLAERDSPKAVKPEDALAGAPEYLRDDKAAAAEAKRRAAEWHSEHFGHRQESGAQKSAPETPAAAPAQAPQPAAQAAPLPAPVAEQYAKVLKDRGSAPKLTPKPAARPTPSAWRHELPGGGSLPLP